MSLIIFPTCGLTFDIFQQKYHYRPDSNAKLGARCFCVYGLALSDPSKSLKMGNFARNMNKNKENIKKVNIHVG